MQKKIRKFFSANYLLIFILSLASFLRFFRINDLLGFWYDQGRDALVIWDFIHKGKTFLIGPMMGFTGMFRGAWFYWLITPFYFLGKGNPIWPSIFLILTSIVAIYVLYKLGEGIGGRKAGLLAALIASVSYYIVGASRWLSDPTPTLLVSVLLVWALFKFLDKKVWALPLIGLLVGFSLQFSAATEIFFIPGVLVIFYLKRKMLPNIKNILISVLSFLVTLVPQGLFELRHPGVLSGALYQFIFHEKTFTLSFWQIIGTRLPYDYNLFYSKFWINGAMLFAPFCIIFVALMIIGWKKFWRDDKFKIIFILSIVPLIGTLFFIGNLGAIYDYYFTGYYLIWILLFSYVFMSFSKNILMKIAIPIFIVILIVQNFIAFRQNCFTPLNDPKIIAFSNQLIAIDWIYKDAGIREFNIDEYVPPVIPYAYQYLFEWLGTQKYQRLPLDKNISLLFTLYEADPDHPERLQAWLDRQKGIGTVLKEQSFGGIVVQERQRISNE
jgi:4-amino-4-deoxy-L-arabinose transferase-like glycosyltransferase